MRQGRRLTAVFAAEGSRRGDGIEWQEAVARLARERTLAETCAALLRKHGDADAIDRGSLAYADAKAEYDGIIAGLSAALAIRDKAPSLPGLEVSLRRGFEKRVAFCKSVQPLVPTKQGEKGIIDEIVASGLIGLFLQAGKEIWFRIRDDNALMRKTIMTQLEAAIWLPFASIPPLP